MKKGEIMVQGEKGKKGPNPDVLGEKQERGDQDAT